MTSSLTPKVLLVASTVGLLSAYGCSSTEEPGNPFQQATAGSSTGTAGSGVGTAGSGTAGSSTGTAGSGSGGSSTGTAGSAGAGMTTAGSGGAGNTAGGNAGGMSGAGGGAGNDITKVWKSDGCGKAYAGATGSSIKIPTKGIKDANCNNKMIRAAGGVPAGTPRCGAWGQESSEWLKTPLEREYFLYLPAGYDPAKAYPIVFMGGGCGATGTGIYPLNDGTAANAGNSVIRVGLTPAPHDTIGHGCCVFGSGCFDDKEGNDSVDWVFYENLYDKLNGEICFDRNRVFASGNSSGAWFANELACKYAGDATRPVRAPMPNTGGLPVPAAEVPTCTQAPMAGMWIHETNDPENPFSGNKVAIARAMALNGCAATTWDNAPKENFPVGSGVAADRCKRITGCNPLYPLVVCELGGNGHGSHDPEANAGFSTFLKMFSKDALITQ